MTVPQRVAGVVCREIDSYRFKRHDVDDVLPQSAHLLAANLRDFEGVPVQMDGMLIATAIAQEEAIASACMHLDRIDVGP